MKTKTIPIKWRQIREEYFTLSCPICGKVWEEDGEDVENPCQVIPCEHLKFRLIEGFDIEWMGEGDYRDIDIEEFYSGEDIKDIDMILSLEEVGVGCGPVSANILYGVNSGVKNDC